MLPGNEQVADQLPDRLSTDPKSPYYNADILARDDRHSLQGYREDQRRGVLRQRGWVRVTAGNARDRYGNPLTIKVHGPVEPYFRDKGRS